MDNTMNESELKRLFNDLWTQASIITDPSRTAEEKTNAAATFSEIYNHHNKEEILECYGMQEGDRSGETIKDAVRKLSDGDDQPDSIKIQSGGLLSKFVSWASNKVENAVQKGKEVSNKIEHGARALVANFREDEDTAAQEGLLIDPAQEFVLPQDLGIDSATAGIIKKAFHEEGIKTNKQASEFLKNAESLGFSIGKIKELAASAENGENEMSEEERLEMLRRSIRFVQHASTDPNADKLRPKIKNVVDDAKTMEDLQNGLLDASEQEGNVDLRNFIGGFMIQESMGFSDKTSQAIADKLSKFGITPQFITDAFKNIKDAGKDLFFTQSLYYNKNTPIYDQFTSRFMTPYRKEAISGIEERQTEAGVHNFQKLFNLSEEDARKWHGFFSDPTVRSLSDNLLRTVATAFGSRVGASADQIERFLANKDALLDGFAGDTVGMYDTMAKDVRDIEAMKQVGQAASIVSLGPTAKNRWMRAEDMSSAFTIMRQSGWNVEDHIVRESQDVQTFVQSLNENERNDLYAQFAAEWAAKQADNDAWESMTENDKSNVDIKEARKVILDASSTEEQRQDALKKMSDQYQNAFQTHYDNALKAAESLGSGTEVSTDAIPEAQRKEFTDKFRQYAGGAALVREISPVRNALQNIKTFMNRVPEARKLNGGKDIDDQKAYELLRALGGSDYAGDQVQYSDRVVQLAQIAARDNISLDRLISSVAETGKTLQQIGLSPALTQVVGEAGMNAFDAAYRAYGGRVDPYRLMAQTQQDAANVANSDVYRNMVWLVANEARFAEGSELKKLAQSAKNGTLTPEQMRTVENTAEIRDMAINSGMTGEQWQATRSQAVFEQNVVRMNRDAANNISDQALLSNQNEFIDLLSEEGNKQMFTDVVTKDVAKAIGYDDENQLFDYTLQLMRLGIDSGRATNILTGKEKLNERTKKELLAEAQKRGINIDGLLERTEQIANNHNISQEQREGWGNIILSGYDSLAISAQTTREGIDAHMTPYSGNRAEQSRLRDLRSRVFAERAPTDEAGAFIEEIIKSDKKGGEWTSEAIKLFASRGMQPEKVKQLFEDGLAGAMLLGRALEPDDQKAFFDILLGENHEQGAEQKLAKEFNYESPEKMFEELSKMSPEELIKKAKESTYFQEQATKIATGVKKTEVTESTQELKANYSKTPQPTVEQTSEGTQADQQTSTGSTSAETPAQKPAPETVQPQPQASPPAQSPTEAPQSDTQGQVTSTVTDQTAVNNVFITNFEDMRQYMTV